jgi:hypothetical protein
MEMVHGAATLSLQKRKNHCSRPRGLLKAFAPSSIGLVVMVAKKPINLRF